MKTEGRLGNSGKVGTATFRSIMACCARGWLRVSLFTPLKTDSQFVAVTVTTGSTSEFGAYVCVPPVTVVVDCSSPKSIIKLSNVPFTSRLNAIVVPTEISSEMM